MDTLETPNYYNTENQPQNGVGYNYSNDFSYQEKSRGRKWWIFGGILLVILIFLGYLGISGLFIYNGLSGAQAKLSTLGSDIENLDNINALQTQLTEVEVDLLKTQQGLGLISWIGAIPGLGNTFDNANILTEQGSRLLVIAKRFIDLGAPILNSNSTDLQQDAALKILFDNKDELEEVYNKLEAIEKQIDTIRYREPMDFVADARDTVLEQFDKLVPLMKLLAGLGQLSPAFYGEVEVPLQYLVLIQNNYELRPTGGFIGNIGNLTIEGGHLKKFVSEDVFNVDARIESTPPAPQPIADAFGDPQWHLRDISWNPDFPVTAALAMSLYQQALDEDALPYQGMMSFTPTFVEKLMEVIGSVTLEPIGTLTASNITMAIEQFVEIDYEKHGILKEDRKAIINELYQLILERILSVKPENYLTLAQAFSSAIEEGHFLFAFPGNPALQYSTEDLGWAGKLEIGVNQDFIQIVDANLAAYKTDSVLKRDYDYSVTVTATDDLFSELEITYTNPGGNPLFISDYHTYLRVYLPRDIQKVVATNFDSEPTVEYGEYHTIVGGFVNVARNKSKTVSINYLLPPFVAQTYQAGNYQLLWEKQLGLPEAGISLNIELPEKGKALGSTNSDGEWSGSHFIMDSILRRNFNLTVNP
ncbi:DUF4012 domain-containing protein [Patescibacteria group bacterium]